MEVVAFICDSLASHYKYYSFIKPEKGSTSQEIEVFFHVKFLKFKSGVY